MIKNALWFTGYVAAMMTIAISLNNYRARAIADYGTASAADNWQQWRDAAEEVGRQGSVDRDRPASVEPPLLVLMRDYFVACLAISLLLSTCLYLWFMVCARGVMKPVVLVEDERRPYLPAFAEPRKRLDFPLYRNGVDQPESD